MGLKNKFSWIVTFFLLAACQQSSKRLTEEQVWLSDRQLFASGYRQFAEIGNKKLVAKVAVKTSKISETANLIWLTEGDESQHITLYGPFGAGAVKLEFDSAGAQLQDAKGKVYHRSSAEQLLSEIIGWPISVGALRYWLFGLPQPDTVSEYRLNAQGQLSEIRQQGWRIQYLQFQDFLGKTMPRKIVALKESESDAVRVKLIAKSWQWN